MESNSILNKEKELDIRQFMQYVIEKIKWIFFVGALFGAIFGFYGFIKTYNSDSKEAVSANIQEIIKKNRTKWNNLDANITSDAFSDPLPGIYIANAKVYVDFDYSNIEGNTNLDFTAMNSKIQGDIVGIACSNESRQAIIANLNLHEYDDMKNLSLDDLKYMTSCVFLGANIIQIQVADSDETRALSIANDFANNLVNSLQHYETVDSVRLLEKASISYSSPYEEIEMSDYVKNIVKFGLVGVFIGVLLVCCSCFWTFCFKETVRTAEDIEYMGLKCIGKISAAEKKQDIEYKRLVCDLVLLEKKNYCVVPVDGYLKLDSFYEKLSLELKKRDIKLNQTSNFIDNPEIILELKNNDAVLIVATYGKTLQNDLELAQKKLQKINVDIIGVLLMES